MNLDPAIFTESTTCSVNGCGRHLYGKGLCEQHWKRKRRGLPIDQPIRVWIRKDGVRPFCAAKDCTKRTRKQDLCTGHYRRKVLERRPDWNVPLIRRVPKTKTRGIATRVKASTLERLKNEARALKRSLAEHVRVVLERREYA
jgi:hypothetical protein